MLAASVLVAVLTSALTVRGMQRADASLLTVRHDTAVVAAATAPAPAPTVAPHRDSVLVAATHADSTPPHVDAGAVGTPPETPPHRTTAPVHAARAVVHREPDHAEKRALNVAEHARVVPPALASQAPQLTRATVTAPPSQPVPQPARSPRRNSCRSLRARRR